MLCFIHLTALKIQQKHLGEIIFELLLGPFRSNFFAQTIFIIQIVVQVYLPQAELKVPRRGADFELNSIEIRNWQGSFTVFIQHNYCILNGVELGFTIE